MRVLVGCETSGRVREAFRKRGHDAWSCDLLPADDGSAFHIQGDIQETLLSTPPLYWDLLIVHPECTFLCVSGLHWNKRRPERARKTEEALALVAWLLNQYPERVARLALENPRGCIGTRLGIRHTQTIQPYDFGHDASKQTDLWLYGLPPLQRTAFVEPRWIDGKPRWGNQTDSGQNRLTPSPDRWKLRSETYQGIADAMASQWG